MFRISFIISCIVLLGLSVFKVLEVKQLKRRLVIETNRCKRAISEENSNFKFEQIREGLKVKDSLILIDAHNNEN